MFLKRNKKKKNMIEGSKHIKKWVSVDIKPRFFRTKNGWLKKVTLFSKIKTIYVKNHFIIINNAN